MSLKSLYKTDPTANTGGVWINHAKNSDGSQTRFKLSRMSQALNKKFAKEIETRTRPYRREIELNTLDKDVNDEIMLDVFIASILLDWEHVQPDDDGNELSYSTENAKRLLGDPEWADLYDDLRERARDAANFRTAALESEAKN